jgi:hypothetical protein
MTTPPSDVRSQDTPCELGMVSSRFRQLLRHEAHLPQGAKELLVTHLAVIEIMEAKLGTDEILPGEFEELVRNCHNLINEVQRLHLASHLRHASLAPF